MKPNQVRQDANNTAGQGAEQSKLLTSLDINLPGIAAWSEWTLLEIADYILKAIKYHRAAILTKVLPKTQGDDAVSLYETVHIVTALAYLNLPLNAAQSVQPRLIGFGCSKPLSLENALTEVFTCLYHQRAHLRLLHTGGKDPEGDLLLAEALPLAHLACYHLALIEDADFDFATALKAREAWIRHTLKEGSVTNTNVSEASVADWEIMTTLNLARINPPAPAQAQGKKLVRRPRR